MRRPELKLVVVVGVLAALALLAGGCARKGGPESATGTPAGEFGKAPSEVGQAGPGGNEAAAPAGGAVRKYKVVISSRPGQWNLDERVRGYQETFAKEFPEIEVVGIIDDETKYSVGEQRASAMLAAHPDIAGFAGVNAASGPGIAKAVMAAQKKGEIVIVAMDADGPVLDQIEAGVITASVAQRQYFMTYIGVKYLYGLVHGYMRKEDIPKEIDTGTVEVNKDNVKIFRTPSQGAKEELDIKHPEWRKLLADRKPGEVKPGEEYVTIGISTGVEYWNATKEGLKDVCEELGVKGTFEGPQDQNPEAQASILDKIIARKPAGILIAPGNPNTLKPYINKAIDAGIPVICIDTDAPESKRLAYFGTSNYQAGCMGARILAKALKAKHEGGGAAG